MNLCDYAEPDACGFYVCKHCGDHKKKRYRRECNVQPDSGPPQTVPRELTVGATLKHIIHTRYHIPPCRSCHETAARMDLLGVEGCRAELDELAEQLQSNAARLNWRQLLAAAVHPVSSVKGAVAASREGLAFYEGLILEACEMVETTQTSISVDPPETVQ